MQGGDTQLAFTTKPTFDLQFINDVTLDNSKLASREESRGKAISDWVKKMQRLNVLKEVQKCDVKFFTHHFAVAKKDSNEPRIVGNFQRLNQVTKAKQAQSVDPYSIATWLAKFQFKTKTDLSRGFYAIEVEAAAQKYLGILHNKRYFVYQKMPMGVKNAPAVFSNYGTYIINKIKKEDQKHIRVMQDDFFVGADDFSECVRITAQLRQVLTADGATVNVGKSSNTPVRDVRCLGYNVSDSVNAVPEKMEALERLVSVMSVGSPATKRGRARILGKLNFLANRDTVVRDILQPCYHILNAIPDWGASTPITQTELTAFASAIRQIKNPQLTSPTYPTQVVFSDASNTFLSCKVGRKIHVWKHKIKKEKSSTYKEVAAVVKAVEMLELPKGVLWYVDNSVAVQILNKLASKATDIQDIINPAKERIKNLNVTFAHISGSQNPADAPSRLNMSVQQARKKALAAEDSRLQKSRHMQNVRRKTFVSLQRDIPVQT